MKISELCLPNDIIDFYIKSGIEELYPPQHLAIESGLLDNKNLVISISTASGKTLLAEFAMLNSILNKNKKSLYIVPLRALASEKYERFSKFKDMKIYTGISTGEFDSKDEWLGNFDIIVATSEKVDSLIRNNAHWIKDIGVVVADEVHLINSIDRGPTLEILLTKLMHILPEVQIIALSATIGNSSEIAEWLNAELVTSEWRPVDLREGVFFNNIILFSNNDKKIVNTNINRAISLVIETIKENAQSLVFESSRRNTENLASDIGKAIAKYIDDKTKLKNISNIIYELSETDTAKKLAKCVENGSAFHHAGLTTEQRKIIEKGFRDGIIKVITATPTLAAGLNLPARRVIIKGHKRYSQGLGWTYIPVMEYKQMAGRAGRPGLDPYGEAILVANNYDEFDNLMNNFVLGNPENILSKLSNEKALRMHILSTIANGFVKNMVELYNFIGTTFYAYQQDLWKLNDSIEKVIDFLVEKKMIKNENGLSPTGLGELISKLYIDPLSGSKFIEYMDIIEEKQMNYTELTLLQIICNTPDMRTLYLRQTEYDIINELIIEYSDELIYNAEMSSVDIDFFFREIKTAFMLYDWITEKKIEYISNKYGIGEGDIRSIVEITKWLAYSMSEIAKFQKRKIQKDLYELSKRVEYGTETELLDLIKIKGIGRRRARRLYSAGYRNIIDILNTDIIEIEKIIGTKTAKKLFKGE